MPWSLQMRGGAKLNILGISCFYHDSAVALLQDGRVVAAAEEERFTRQKHTRDFPSHALDFCLSQGGIKFDDLDYIAFYEVPRLKFHRLIMTYLDQYPHSREQFFYFLPMWMQRTREFRKKLESRIRGKTRIVYVQHHGTHGAAAFLPSPFEKAAILTVDGVGEWATTSWGVGQGNRLSLHSEIRFPHSLGLLYSTITSYLGFRVNNGEGKVMGLASYGEPRFIEQFQKLIRINPDGTFCLNMDYFNFHRGLEMFNDRFHRLFDCQRQPEAAIEKKHMDMAATLQYFLESAMVLMARDIRGKTGLDSLCIAGGVGLNSVANGRILKESGFRNIFIQPASSDAGSALGAALYVWNCLLNRPERWAMNPYLGYRGTRHEVEKYLDRAGIPYEKLDDNELFDQVAGLISRDKMVGWYRGRMEFGPRALGNRSILANPRSLSMKDVLNARVKFREPFRPYAAAVMEDHLGDYFDCTHPSPHMLLVYNVLEHRKLEIPSVTHVDGTCRVQSVTEESNGDFYRLIDAFYRVTGTPVLLNTSFNIRGEPIVMTVRDAVNCYQNTGLDALAADNCLLVKDRGEAR